MKKIILLIGIVMILIVGCEEKLKCNSEVLIQLEGLEQPHRFLVNNHDWQDMDGLFKLYDKDNLTIFWKDKNQTYKIHEVCDDVGMPHQYILTKDFCENQTIYQGVECIK